MGYLITGLVSLVVGVLLFAFQVTINENKRLKELQKQKEEEEKKREAERRNALEEGVLCILREMLIQSHAKYTKRHSISSKALESGLAMYHAYKGLGGNGMVDHMKDEIEELQIIDE